MTAVVPKTSFWGGWPGLPQGMAAWPTRGGPACRPAPPGVRVVLPMDPKIACRLAIFGTGAPIGGLARPRADVGPAPRIAVGFGVFVGIAVVRESALPSGLE